MLTGCFSVSNSIDSINPFSEKKVIANEKVEIEIPSDAPLWLQEKNLPNQISAIGLVKNIQEDQLDLFKQQALIGASNNLLKRIYLKTGKLYKAYTEKLENPKIFDKDIKKFSEHIALKSLTYSTVKNSWIDKSDNKNDLYLQISVDSAKVAEQIQQTSKLLFDSDQMLFQHFLSNRANQEIINYLEK